MTFRAPRSARHRAVRRLPGLWGREELASCDGSYTLQLMGGEPGTEFVASDPVGLAARRNRIFDPHVEPLNRWVQSLRDRLPDGSEVPWFDPADGGARARLLWLGDEPVPADLYSTGGSGFVSLDGPSQRSQNSLRAARAAGLNRSLLVVWNAVPVNLRELRRASGDKSATVDAAPLLGELLGLLPDLQVVVLAGRTAWETFHRATPDPSLVVLATAAVRNGALDGRDHERAALEAVWVEAAATAAPIDVPQLTSGDGGVLPELAEVPPAGNTVVVQPIGHRQVVAFGAQADLEALGRVGDPVPSPMVTAFRTGAAALPAVAKAAMSGRVVMLTKESSKLIQKGRLVPGGDGSFLGVVRDASNGRWLGQIRFQDLGRMGVAATAVPNVLAAVAMQQQMASIEKKLVAVQERLDELLADRRLELEAGLDTNLEILAEVTERTRRRDELEPAQWQRLTTIEPRVRDFQKRTWSALSNLSAALDPERPVATRTKELTGMVRDDGLARQFVNLVKAEVALARWQGLQLLHDAQEHPEELESRTEAFLAETRGRHHELVVLARRLDAYLGVGASANLLDRVKGAMRRDATTLRSGLADVLDAYRDQMELLGLEAPPPPPALAELTMGDQIGDTLGAVKQKVPWRRR